MGYRDSQRDSKSTATTREADHSVRGVERLGWGEKRAQNRDDRNGGGMLGDG